MDKLTITFKVPTDLVKGMREWLTLQGEPEERGPEKQAAYLCKEYLKAAYKRAQQTAKNGAPFGMP